MLFLFFRKGAGVVVTAGDDVVGVPVGAAVVIVAANAVFIIVVSVSGVEERFGTGVKVTVFSRTRLLRFA